MAEKKTALGLPENTTAALAYGLWLYAWVGGLAIFLLEKDNKFVRFHALQSTIFFGVLMILEMLLSNLLMGSWTFFSFLRLLMQIIQIGGTIVWIVCLVKAYQGEKFMIPVVGEFVEKQLGK